MQSYENQNTLQDITDAVSSLGSPTPGFRVASPSLSVYSGVTSIETNSGSGGGMSVSYSTAFASAVARQRALTFNLVDWGWNDESPAMEEDPILGPTPRQRTHSLPRVIVGPNINIIGPVGPAAPLLRPLPPEVPESCPSLYRPGPGSILNEDEDEDDRTEAESIWFCNEDNDAQIATSASQTFPSLLDIDPTIDGGVGNGNEDVVFNPPETFEDFPDLDVIIATVRASNEDVIVEGAIEDLNSL